MIKINIPCDCEEDAEHEVEVSAEAAYPNRIGLYYPNEGDELPCGRKITEDDLVYIVDRLREYGRKYDE